MTENDLYDYLQALMPELQFIDNYTDDVPVPLTDYATFNVLNIADRGWSQGRQAVYNEERDKGVVKTYYDVQRIYTVQLDFYGANAYDNASKFKQTLQVALAKKFGVVDLKMLSPIRNLTFLQENKTWQKRYNFDAELFVVDTVERNSPIIETATVKIINRGNNFN